MSGFYELTPAEQGERVAALARAALGVVGPRGARAHAAQVSRERGLSRGGQRRAPVRDPGAPRRLSQRRGAALRAAVDAGARRRRLRRARAGADATAASSSTSSRIPMSPSRARSTCSAGSTAGRSAASRAVSRATSRRSPGPSTRSACWRRACTTSRRDGGRRRGSRGRPGTRRDWSASSRSGAGSGSWPRSPSPSARS